MNIVLFGAPGSGKGTQSALMVEKIGFKHFSTGDLFRAAIKNQTELGKLAKSYIDKGHLVPDEVTVGLIKECFKKLSKSDSFVLDGFPRNINQAESLKQILRDLGLKLDKAIFLHVDKQLLMDRLVGRRVCKNCGAVYHIQGKPTMKAGVCDSCGGEVVQRADDMPEVIENRLNVYEDNTAPLKNYYKTEGLYEEVNGAEGQDRVFERLTLALKK